MEISNVLKITELKKIPAYVKQLKILCRKTTGEALKIFDDDYIILALYNKKIIGFCCIAMKSPESHFENEATDLVPYIYNYIVDILHRKRKTSILIMNAIKLFIKDTLLKSDINLDSLYDNSHAINFFERNNFIACGKYEKNTKSYLMFSCCLNKETADNL